MADTIRINADTSGAIRSINNLENSLNGLQSKLGGLQRAIAGLALGSFISQTIQMGDAMADAAKAAGISTQALMGFGDALAQNGGNFDSAARGIADFNKSIADAADGNIKAQEQFSKLGISLNDLATLSEQDLLAKTVQGLGRLTDASQRASIAQAMFGKAAKGVDFAGAAANIDQLTAAQARNAAAVDAASAVSDSLGASYRELQVQTLNALKPIADLATKLLENTDAVRNAISVVINLASAFTALFIVDKVTSGIKGMVDAFRAIGASGGGAAKTISQLAAEGNVLANARLGITQLSQAFNLSSAATVKTYTGFGIFSQTLKSLAGGFGRLIPFIGVAYSAFEILDAVIKTITGNGLVGWLDEAGAALARFFGISYQTSKQKEDLAKKEEDAAKAAKKAADDKSNAENKVRDVTLNATKELDKQLAAYKESNAEAIKQIQNNTALIGLSEEQRSKQQALFDLETKRLKEVNDLETKRKESKLPEQQAAYADAIKKVNAEYANSKTQLEGAVDAQQKKTRQEQLSVFANEQLVSAIRQLNDLNQQAATALLPELEKKYRDIEAAAQAAAAAQIAAEERRRGAPLSDAERAKYLEAARVKTEELKAATERLNAVEKQKALNTFAIKERVDLENQLQKIQDDIAKTGLTTIEKKYYDIEAAARASAKAAIDAEAARRGNVPLSAEEQKKYYDAALRGTDALKSKQRELYDNSRTFATGWKQAFNDYVENATDAAQQAQRMFSVVTRGMEDTIIKFAKTGKFEWKQFVANITEELLRGQIQKTLATVLGPISKLMGLDLGSALGGSAPGSSATNPMYVLPIGGGLGGGMAGGVAGAIGGGAGSRASPLGGIGKSIGGAWDTVKNIGSNIGSALGGAWESVKSIGSSIWDTVSSWGSGISDGFAGMFANGGMIPAGKFGLVGERGPEYISGPAQITPMSGSVTYNINAVDAASFKAMIAADPGFIHAVAQQGARGIPARR